MKFRLRKPTAISDEVLCAIIMLSGLLGKLSAGMGLICNCIGLALAAVLLLNCFIYRRISLDVYALFFGGFLLATLNILFVGQLQLQKYAIILIIYFAAGLYLSMAETLNYNLWRIVFFVAVAVVMYNWMTTADEYHLFYGTSRNFVSVFLLIFLIPLVYAAYLNNRKISALYYVLIFVCSVSAIGRSGIAFTGLLLGAIYIYRVFMNPKVSVRTKYLHFSLLCVALIVFLAMQTTVMSALVQKLFSRFIEMSNLQEEPRIKILSSYLESVDAWWKVLLGSNSRKIVYLQKWNGNIHNSYMLTHATFGLIGMIALVVGVISAICMLIKDGKTELGIVLSIFAMRCLVDSIFYAQLGDAIAWFCMLYALPRLRGGRKVYFLVRSEET